MKICKKTCKKGVKPSISLPVFHEDLPNIWGIQTQGLSKKSPYCGNGVTSFDHYERKGFPSMAHTKYRYMTKRRTMLFRPLQQIRFKKKGSPSFFYI